MHKETVVRRRTLDVSKTASVPVQDITAAYNLVPDFSVLRQIGDLRCLRSGYNLCKLN